MNPVEGTIPHGTLRTQDLIESFMDALQSLDEATYIRLNSELVEMRGEMGEDWFDSEDASEMLDELFDTLDAIASESGMYFGATEGDGSDFGFWTNEEGGDE